MNVIIFSDVNTIGYGKYAGPYKIATELRRSGYSVQVIDNYTKCSTEKLKRIINKFVSSETLWVGFSTTFTEVQPVKKRISRQRLNKSLIEVLGREDIEEILSYIKDLNKTVRIVAGGANARILKTEELIDHVVIGQGETSVLALTNAIKNNEKLPRVLTEHLFPYNEFTNSIIEYQSQDIIFPGEHLTIEFSRGCIFKCKFCNYPLLGKKLWDFVKSPALIASEMQRNYDLFQTKGYLVTDDTINDSVEKIEELHKSLTNLPFDLTLSSYARLDLIVSHPHTLDLLYEMGIRSLFFGVETFNHESGKIIGKGMHPDKIKQGLEYVKTRYPDIMVSIGLIFGLPGETAQSLEETIEYLKSCPADNVTISPYFINPESTIGKNPEKYGYIVNNPMDWKNEHLSWQQCSELTNIADSFLDTKNKLSWFFINRVMNCGYTLDQCQNTLLKDVKTSLRDKKQTVIKNYFDQLLSS